MIFDNIHEDARGFIKAITGGFETCPELTIMKTNAGFARGGCIHPESKEHLVVIEGVIKYVYGEDQKHKMLQAGQGITIDKNIPHFFLSITDSIVAEWGPQIEEKQGKYQPMRDLVNSINKVNKD